MELVKISLTRKKKVLVVKGQLNWDLIREAVLEVNGIIARGSPVSCEYVDKAQMAEGGPRAKLDRIVDQRVRVVRIGEHDQAACAGVHLRDAREIGMLLVSKFTSARPTGDWEIEFLVGPAAVSAAVEHAVRALMLAERLGSLPQDTLTAFDNRERELVSYREALKVYGRQALASIPSQEVGGIRVLSGSFLGLDRKMLMERASELASGPRALIALMSQDERAFLVLARSGDLELDCVSLLNRLLGPHGGRGGGRPNFASGGTPGPVDGENVLRELIRIIEEGL
jgi:alanyl-tRNA synthetase